MVGLLLGLWVQLQAQSHAWLGTLGGYGSEAYGISADGRVVAGWAVNASSYVVVDRSGSVAMLARCTGSYIFALRESATVTSAPEGATQYVLMVRATSG